MIKVNKPKIRFKNFNDSWSLRKLSDTQTDYKDGNYGEAYPKETDLTSSTQGIPFLRGSDLDNGKLTLTNARYITQSKHNELISGHLIEDDIVIAVRGSLGSLGYVGPDNEGWNINSQLAIIRTRKIELIGNYLIQFLLSNRGNKEISSHITGTALKQLPIKQLKNIKVPIPKIEEQSAIGSLFRTLDHLLASYKDNLANYQALKTTMLSKMFPKAGQTVPEVRLDGFEGEWEKTTLEKSTDRVKSYSLSRDVETNQDTGLKYIHYGDIHLGKVSMIDDGDSIPYIKSDTKMNEFLQQGDLIFADASEDYKGIAEVAVIATTLSEKIVAGLHTIAVRPYSIFDSIFLYYMFKTQTFRKYGYKVGTGMKVFGISPSNLMKYEFFYPDKKEQQAISAYFSNLDSLINSHQEKISQLETLKKKLLKDMFI